MYIYMNKEKDRILSENNYLSGDLSVTSIPVNFKPVLVKGNFKEKVCNLLSDLVMVKVDTSETFTSDTLQQTDLIHHWLLHEDSGVVYRVWDGHHSNPHNCSKLLLKEGTVMIKGVGTFSCNEFKVFKF